MEATRFVKQHAKLQVAEGQNVRDRNNKEEPDEDLDKQTTAFTACSKKLFETSEDKNGKDKNKIGSQSINRSFRRNNSAERKGMIVMSSFVTTKRFTK